MTTLENLQYKKAGSLTFEELSALYDEAKHSTKSSDHDALSKDKSSMVDIDLLPQNGGIDSDVLSGDGDVSLQNDELESDVLQHDKEDHPELVVRNDHYCSQRATVSFGVEATQDNAGILDVVNYYKPDLANEPSVDNDGFGTINNGEHPLLPSEGFAMGVNKFKETKLYGKGGRPRGHVGGDSTTSSIIVNSRIRNNHSPHSGYTYASPYNTLVDSVMSSDSDAGKMQNGLFEVPFNVYSVPRLVDPFKGFSKIHTQRAIKLLHFSKVDSKLTCKVDKSASRLLKKQIGNCKVVSTSIVGDPRSGKSYLAGLLVGKGSKSFKISDPFAVQTKCEGTVWIYVAVYEEKYAYIFLDFDGFEGSDSDRIKMLSFALAASNCVLASFKASVMSGVFELVQSMINLSANQADDESEEGEVDNENEIVELFRKKTTRLFLKDDGDEEDDDTVGTDLDKLWSPPIVHFIFRDSNDFIKCLDERNYTPETLVEQGIFEHYLDIFKCTSDTNMEFKNNMLDAFGIFTNRKYTCLPYPLRARKNTKPERYGVGQMLLKFLAPHEAKDSTTEDDYDIFPTQNISLMPMTALSNHFFEKLDEIKTCVYHDTLSHSRANSQLSGRMFIRFIKLLVEHFNVYNAFTIKDLNSILTEVHFDENESVKKDSIVYFLKIVKTKIAPLLPINSRELLSKSIEAKQKALQYFEAKAFGTFEDYSKVYNALGTTLDELVAKLDRKNTSIINHKITSFIERRADVLNYRIARKDYTPQDLDAEILKTKRALQRKFDDAVVVDSALTQVSQKLVEMFNNHHPDVYIARIYTPSIDIKDTVETYTSKFTMLPTRLSIEEDDDQQNEEESSVIHIQDGSMGECDIDAHVDETTPHTISEDITPPSVMETAQSDREEKRVTIAERPITITRVY